mmetsp:Transcript_11789/g.22076  ORF Transcript_11789/g.22076 Transcript_11789/m.22076 type:complete len:214 (-) Transcript_11789:727-1368(-)
MNSYIHKHSCPSRNTIPTIVSQSSNIPSMRNTLWLTIKCHIHSLACQFKCSILFHSRWYFTFPKDPCPSPSKLLISALYNIGCLPCLTTITRHIHSYNVPSTTCPCPTLGFHHDSLSSLVTSSTRAIIWFLFGGCNIHGSDSTKYSNFCHTGHLGQINILGICHIGWECLVIQSLLPGTLCFRICNFNPFQPFDISHCGKSRYDDTKGKSMIT